MKIKCLIKTFVNNFFSESGRICRSGLACGRLVLKYAIMPLMPGMIPIFGLRPSLSVRIRSSAFPFI